MADSLRAVASALAGVRPELDGAGQIVSLVVDVNLSYADSEGKPVMGRMVSFDAWKIFSDAQKEAMQDIQQTLTQYIVQTYFA